MWTVNPLPGVQEVIDSHLAHHENKPLLFSESHVFDAFPQWMQSIVVKFPHGSSSETTRLFQGFVGSH